MKNILTVLMVLIFAVGKLTAQTRNYTVGYSNLPIELAGASDELLTGDYGVLLGTHKFKTNKIMRGFVLSFHQLSTEIEYLTSDYNDATGMFDYVSVMSDITVRKYTFGYESIRIWGKKEIDDKGGSFYGTMGYYLHYNSVQQTYQSDMPGYNTDEMPDYGGDLYFAPVDLSLKLGIGYQYKIARQFLVYAEGKTYVSILGNAGYEYGIGIRYKTFGSKY
jgi:hypothetical protein